MRYFSSCKEGTSCDTMPKSPSILILQNSTIKPVLKALEGGRKESFNQLEVLFLLIHIG